ncbi:acetate--CoA ligase family protein [Alicycliphilus denitrificans]|uniref:CoA-binding protein n=1 Tax=Alicycliphilus denitrificans TaxID=179636 RepID=A0A420KGT0_9BURK|nr:acetate--CoA ligase family protein [Alicycliphilus denitrificans]RKJ99162.1 CoA-binding protein [Alicycliphilus denitrificans]
MHDLDSMFSPAAVAVVGASEGTEKIGGKVLATLMKHGFAGQIYPVNPARAEIAGLKAYPNVSATPGPVDLALIAIPASMVPDCVQECAQKGVRAAVIFSSGFRDAGEEGARLEQRLKEIGAATGIRISGPNAEGFYNVAEGVAATFSPAINIDKGQAARADRIGIISQSGGLGFAFFNRGRRSDMSFSHIVSVGNQVDLEIAEYLEYMVEQPQTRVLMMYVESLRNPARFLRAAERAADMGKPIVMVKVGRSKAGQRAAQSHTGAIAGSTQVADAVFAHHGIVMADDQDRLLDTAAGFARHSLPQGSRVAIVSASGGTAVWLADACEAAGLELPEIDQERQARIAEFIPEYGSPNNPVDITAQGVDGYARSLAILADAPYVDAIILAATFAHERRLVNEGQAIAEITRRIDKPVFLYSYTLPSEKSLAIMQELGLHCYTSLQGCVHAIKSMWQYQQFLSSRASRRAPARTSGQLPQQARALLAHSQASLCEYDSKELLRQYGIGVPREELAATADEAVAHAQELGYPVALKVQSPDIPHKTEAGVVRLALKSEEQVRQAFEEVCVNARSYAPQAQLRGVLVQPMARPGLELMAGIINDPDFGPMVMTGLGGIHVEVLEDVALEPAPLTHATARSMLQRLRGYRLLEGVRGQPPRDIEAVAALLVQLSHLAHDARDKLAEFDVNPIFVHEAGQGVTVVDALGIPAVSGR